MEQLHVRDVMKLSADEVWNLRFGPTKIVFDNNETLEMVWLEVAISWHVYKFIDEFGIAITPNFSLNNHLKAGRFVSDTHRVFLSYALFYVVDTVGVEKMDYLTHRITNIRDDIYNYAIQHTSDSVVAIDMLSVIEILKHPLIARLNANVQPTAESIEHAIGVISNVIDKAPSLQNNEIVRMMKSGVIRKSQLLQCIAPRNELTDINSMTFPTRITRGYAMGLRSIVMSIQESRSAAKSIEFSHRDLQNTEYGSRKLQLLEQNVRKLHHCDCGSTHYKRFSVKSSDLPNIVGKFYLDETTNTLKAVRNTDKHLIGTTIKMRNVKGCIHPDPAGVCLVCFGELGFAVYPETNLGHMCTVTLTEKMTQGVLSTKHEDGQVTLTNISLPGIYHAYLKPGRDDSSYYLAPSRYKRSILVEPGFIYNINDLFDVKSIYELTPHRFSQIPSIGMKISSGDVVSNVQIPIAMKHRVPSFSFEFLEWLRETNASGTVPYTVNEVGAYEFDITNYSETKPIFVLPARNYNMADFAKEISGLIESSIKDLEKRDKFISPDTLLMELYEHINSRLNVNIAVIEVIVLGTMIRSAERFDYRLPKPDTESGLGVLSKLLAYRSFAATLCYEGHAANLRDPINYLIDNRMDHTMDEVFMPQEVAEVTGFI